jgi:hypothetical protein
MLFGYFTLIVALLIEVVGAYYSITGLAAIFSGAIVPILIMGGSLELGKVVAAVWLKNNWERASLQYKLYLLPAVVMLMLITSMGIFGFLSKAHNDQNLVSGDVQGKIAIYDEKIKISKENIDANRKALKQMDEAVDQVMGRSSDEKGADKAVAIRRGQQKERARLQSEIQAEQKTITALNEERAPIAAEVRQVEAEVGPIKYIAKLIYDDNPDANILEKAVVWVIMIIVAVFDPLALVLILAAQQSIRWARDEKEESDSEAHARIEQELAETMQNLGISQEPKYEADNGPLTAEQLKQIQESADKELPTGEVIAKNELFPQTKDPHPPGWMWVVTAAPQATYPDTDEEVEEFSQAKQTAKEQVIAETLPDPLSHIEVPEIHPEDQHHLLAKQSYLAQHPEIDERLFYAQHQDGEIDHLPWHDVEHINTLPISDGERKQLIDRFANNSLPVQEPTIDYQFLEEYHEPDLHVYDDERLVSKFDKIQDVETLDPKNDGNLWVPQSDGTWANAGPMDQFDLGLSADNSPKSAAGIMRGFGTSFPGQVAKGDMFLRVDQLPSALYKFNGTGWIEVDKKLSDQYIYDEAYIDHLIEKIGTGEYDPDLLSDAERESIEKRLIKKA